LGVWCKRNAEGENFTFAFGKSEIFRAGGVACGEAKLLFTAIFFDE
jgi:hypothetical protein